MSKLVLDGGRLLVAPEVAAAKIVAILREAGLIEGLSIPERTWKEILSAADK